MYCSKCGAKLLEDSAKCDKCGTPNADGFKKDILTYDYITVETDNGSAPKIADCYKALGWELINSSENYDFFTVLNFKRNRKIKNKDQLNKLQVKLDDAFTGIGVFENKKTISAMIISLIIGFSGALILAGGLSLCILNPAIWSIIAGSLLIASGICVCCLNLLIYRKISAKKTAAMNASIQQKREEIDLLCKEAQKFLSCCA